MNITLDAIGSIASRIDGVYFVMGPKSIKLEEKFEVWIKGIRVVGDGRTDSATIKVNNFNSFNDKGLWDPTDRYQFIGETNSSLYYADENGCTVHVLDNNTGIIFCTN